MELAIKAYTLQTGPPPLAGTHEVWAIVNASGTLSATSSKSFSIVSEDGSRPVVQINYPADGDLFTSTSSVRLSAQASDPDGSLESVQFYVNGAQWMDTVSFETLNGETITLSDGASTLVFTFGGDVNIGSSASESRDNCFQGYKL